ncbi:ABC transporter permease [Virgibacillus pantothenticus]|uniref:ABC transporter permease n=1 Tax=Virgibacillus pantothenticus TaxID=1473 RepID=UPI001BCA9458|nr:ABC transporter permease [Virgibacillus pantothenticus]MBU8568386.1 ABC transporter permease [Virgibacillus pantothenticus]MBU8602342.1 ABC transporter permease [Virgibacillus pantothenticus]MBU8636477.1 ABC transporter permease [Virgibacillus pantothenticus]MBU8642034.1 ABC transporter permease [Virgibacillus pantothenticus]MBU8645817.1 ABC transporter permease [Virgibacillus pantothenticus]
MIQLIKNELIKIRSEKYIKFIFILNLIPLILNFANFIVNNRNMALENGFYFTFYNQYFMLLPIITSIIISSIFYIEYRNNTYLDWITYNISRMKLFFSKLLVSLLLMLIIFLSNLVILLGFYSVIDGGISNLYKIVLSFTTLHLIVVISVSLIFSVIIQLTRNIVISISIGIGGSLISMILMAAPFSYMIPLTFGYRAGLYFVDNEFYYEDPLFSTFVGIGLTVILTLFMLILSFKIIKNKTI